MANTDNVKTNSSELNNGNDKGTPTPKKRRHVAPMWRILGKARKVFDAQLLKTNEVKRTCIATFMNAEVQDSAKFWGDFIEQVEKLMDSRKYLRDCKVLGYEPENVAEHIVFLGSATINKVLKNGLKETLGNDLHLYKDRFSPKDADIYVSNVTAFKEKVAPME